MLCVAVLYVSVAMNECFRHSAVSIVTVGIRTFNQESEVPGSHPPNAYSNCTHHITSVLGLRSWRKPPPLLPEIIYTRQWGRGVGREGPPSPGVVNQLSPSPLPRSTSVFPAFSKVAINSHPGACGKPFWPGTLESRKVFAYTLNQEKSWQKGISSFS
jgi:hypothetical protein